MHLLLLNLITICVSAVPLNSLGHNNDPVRTAVLFTRSLEYQPISTSGRLLKNTNLSKRSEETSESVTDDAIYQNKNSPLDLQVGNSYKQVPYVYASPRYVPAGYAGPVIVASGYGPRRRPAPRPVRPAGYAPRPIVVAPAPRPYYYPASYPMANMPPIPQVQGYPPVGPSIEGYPPVGPAIEGYPPVGPSIAGYPPIGPSIAGYPPVGPSVEGYPPFGAPPTGYPPQMPPNLGPDQVETVYVTATALAPETPIPTVPAPQIPTPTAPAPVAPTPTAPAPEAPTPTAPVAAPEIPTPTPDIVTVFVTATPTP